MHWWSVTELVKCWDDSSRTSLDFQVRFAWGQMQTILWLLPVLLMFLNNMKPFIWFRCFGSIADLSHIRTQWCLAGCLTKRPANLQRLIDTVRQGVLKEVDAHPPLKSLLEQALPQVMVAYSLQSSWFQRRCISVKWHPERFLTIFWICAGG